MDWIPGHCRLIDVIRSLVDLFPARLPVPTGSKSQNNDASKVEKELTEDKQPETMKEWWTELMNVVKRLASSKVYVLQTISFTCFLFGKFYFLQIMHMQQPEYFF